MTSKPAYVHEQFQDIDQQTHSATLGMWTFLATEILFFGVLFSSYTMCRIRWPDAFRHGSEDLKIWIGGINTAVLLTSSLFMALGVRAAALGNNKWVVNFLWITIALGVAFLGFKALEYYLEYQEHLVPGINFTLIPPDEAHLPASQQHPRPNQEQLFMLFYFIMTALHATHMLVGIGVMLTLIVLTRRGHYSREYHNPIEIAGLYWHFVDIVWVFLYPALYLLRQSWTIGDAMSEQTHSVKLYVLIYGALLALLVLTVGLSFIDIGRYPNNIIAMVIACAKGLLIVLFFMHVRYSPALTWFFAGAGFLWLCIMLTLTGSDYVTRNHPQMASPKGEPVFLWSNEPRAGNDSSPQTILKEGQMP